ncbi:protein CTLA-2-alpha-like [Diabrotica virgifera virgifera]|uniref:Protein CTLA-2-alpha-like n=1 Tax=Diabrotica virgifera virgifera TaxID=50390 RepID=A0A6P7FGU4_DIAVI|nr:protein CTLA-2-alpha-like [Diabrotica virgifera virgifera]
MFFKIMLLALFVVATTADESLEQQWRQFKLDHNRNYDAAEDAKRFKIFTETVEKIKTHNKLYHSGKSTYELGLTDFSDKTPEELSKHHGLYVRI